MAAIALRTSGDLSLDVVESTIQDTQSAAVALNPGDMVAYDANGSFTTTGIAQTSLATARIAYGVVVRKVAAGEYVTAIRKGVLDGLNLDSLAYNDPLYVGTTGTVETAGGTAAFLAGRVIPGRAQSRGVAADKLLFVDL